MLLPLYLVSQTAAADQPCVKTAWKMFGACGLDIREGRKETIANCINISNQQAHHDCFSTAREAGPEEGNGCIDQFIL